MISVSIRELRESVCGLREVCQRRKLKKNKTLVFQKHDHESFPLGQFGLFNFTEISELRKLCESLHQEVDYAMNRVTKPSIKLLVDQQVSLSSSKSKLLLLELDGMLVKKVKSCDPKCTSMSFQLRPYVWQFLKKVEKYYDIVVWTSKTLSCAERIVRELNKNHKYIKGILNQEHCLKTKNGSYIKDLRIIGDWDKRDVIIVDHKISSFSFHLENGIPVQLFEGNEEDEVLVKLEQLLIEAHSVPNVQMFLKQKLRLRDIIKLSSEEYVEQVVSSINEN